MARQGTPAAALWREVGRRHGRAAAERCREEFSSLVAGGELADGGELGAAGAADGALLKALCLNVAHDCDLRCRYCFAGQGGFGGDRALMSAEVARAAVDFLLASSGDLKTCEIDFFGGEPLLNLEVVRDTVAHARRREAETGKAVRFTLTTNATALGPDEAAYLDETMGNVVLSLDGRPTVHDRMRPLAGGRPSHARVLANIKGFVTRRGERDYWVRGTYTALNLDFTEDVAYLAAEGIRNISIEPVVAANGRSAPWALTEAHLPVLAAEYLRLADFLHDRAATGRPVRFFHFIVDPDAGPCYAKRVRGCGAGREYMAVTPGGDLYPCHQFVGRAEFRAGNVLDGPDRSLAVSGPAAEVGRLWLGSKEACRTCWARYRCSGGCHANAFSATGSLLHPDPLGCELFRARLEASLYLQARRALDGGARRALA